MEVNKGQIGQVINNMTMNSIKAMPDGGKLFIGIRNVTLGEKADVPLPPGNYVEIELRDQGAGIRPEHIEHVFDPYFTTKKRGSGLGLAICFSVVQKHSGHISVESELGRERPSDLPACVSRNKAKG